MKYTVARRHLCGTALAGLAFTIPLPTSAQEPHSEPAVRNLILLVADGVGVAHWTLARMARGDALAVASMPVAGLVDTRNVQGRITDSAAAATAYATGRRSFNKGISLEPRCDPALVDSHMPAPMDPPGCGPMETLLEAAERRGKATGLVSTTSVVDATLAAFAAHVPSRYMGREIAGQMLTGGVDVILGGGRAAFQADGHDLLDGVCTESDCPATGAELAALAPSERRLIGLFASGELPRAGARDPDLPALAQAALDRPSRDPHGFFLLVESEGTDTYSHGNEGAKSITAEIVEFDRAVEMALVFAERTPGTLVVVTADHETGGLAIHEEQSGPELRYTTSDHTGAMVPLFAAGPGARRLAGIRDNDEVGRILIRLLIGVASAE